MMMNKKGVLAAMVPAMLLGLLVPEDAEACSCFFSCSNTIVTGDKLASGAEGFYWFLGGGGVAPGDIGADALLLEKLVDGAYQKVEHELTYSHPRGTVHIARPVGGFEIGATYRFTADLNGWQSGCQVEIEQNQIDAVAVAEAEIISVTPTSKLTANVSDQVIEEIAFESDAACEEDFLAAYRDVSIELPADLQGMEGSLFYEVTVNGESYIHEYNSCFFQDILPGGLDQDRLTTRLATTCEQVPDYAANGALAEGMHEVVVSAYLPESDVFKWTSDPVMVELDCGNAMMPPEDMGGSGEPDLGFPGPPGDPDLGVDDSDMGASGEEDMGSEQPADDMGTSAPDMGAMPPGNGGTDGGGEDEDGCSQVSLAGAGVPAGSALLMALLGLFGLRRRRR